MHGYINLEKVNFDTVFFICRLNELAERSQSGFMPYSKMQHRSFSEQDHYKGIIYDDRHPMKRVMWFQPDGAIAYSDGLHEGITLAEKMASVLVIKVRLPGDPEYAVQGAHVDDGHPYIVVQRPPVNGKKQREIFVKNGKWFLSGDFKADGTMISY